MLTHWGRVTYIRVGKLTIIVSGNGLSPGRRQAIIWTNAGISLIGPLGTNFSEILIEIHTFSIKNSFETVVCEMAAILSRPQCVKGRCHICTITLYSYAWEHHLWINSLEINSIWWLFVFQMPINDCILQCLWNCYHLSNKCHSSQTFLQKILGKFY